MFYKIYYMDRRIKYTLTFALFILVTLARYLESNRKSEY